MAKPLPKLEEMQDILDLKDIQAWDLRWIWGIAISLGLILAFFLARALWRRYRRPAAEEAGPPLSPEQRALKRLEELVNSRLVESGQIRRFYFGLSDLFREFIEGELEIPACEATLEELRPALRASPWLDNDQVRDAHWLLELADMAKFAQFVPPREEILKSVKLARTWIQSVAGHRAKVLAEKVAPAPEEAKA
ncbi:MAG TPA: hypothetical protein VJR29_12825 [bacterium]|nr:hypothetical protein [bacterium]